MNRLLIVANQTLGSPELDAVIEDRAAQGLTAVVLVAPVTVTEGEHQWDYPAIDRYVPDPKLIAHALAEGRLEHEIARLRAQGLEVTGEVVDTDPVSRVTEIIVASQVDEVLVCTLPERFSRWLRMDLPHRLERNVHVPVVHVRGSSGPSL